MSGLPGLALGLGGGLLGLGLGEPVGIGAGVDDVPNYETFMAVGNKQRVSDTLRDLHSTLG